VLDRHDPVIVVVHDQRRRRHGTCIAQRVDGGERHLLLVLDVRKVGARCSRVQSESVRELTQCTGWIDEAAEQDQASRVGTAGQRCKRRRDAHGVSDPDVEWTMAPSGFEQAPYETRQ